MVEHRATGRSNDQVGFEQYVIVVNPQFEFYAPRRDPAPLQEFPGRTGMFAVLQKHGIDHRVVLQAAASLDGCPRPRLEH